MLQAHASQRFAKCHLDLTHSTRDREHGCTTMRAHCCIEVRAMLAARRPAAAPECCLTGKHERPSMAFGPVADLGNQRDSIRPGPRSTASASSKLMADPFLAAKHKTAQWASGCMTTTRTVTRRANGWTSAVVLAGMIAHSPSHQVRLRWFRFARHSRRLIPRNRARIESPAPTLSAAGRTPDANR